MGEFRFRSLAVFDECLETHDLHGIDVDLTMCDFGNLHVVKDLHVCLCHLHTDVVFGLLEVSGSGLEIQLVQLNLIGNLESREERHVGTQLERRR